MWMDQGEGINGEGKVMIQEDPWTERTLRKDLVQHSGQGYPWLRGGMASSSSVAGGKEVRVAGIWVCVSGSGACGHRRLCRV